MPWDFSSIFYGNDIYDTVLREILGVRPTGDPVKDSVYLVVLPLLTLYLFSSHVSSLMHLGKTKLKWVFMAIIFFFVVDRGYYRLLTDYAMFAFIALMIWGAWTFITSPKIEDEGGKGSGHGPNMGVYNMDVGGSGGHRSYPGLIINDAVRGVKDSAGLTPLELKQRIADAEASGRGRDALAFTELLEKQNKKKSWFGLGHAS